MAKKFLIILILVIAAHHQMASAIVRVSCLKSEPKQDVYPKDHFRNVLKSNKIKVIGKIEPKYIDIFVQEYKKFPVTLGKELLTNNAQIHLIQGKGVTADPSWPSFENTFDGRSWDKVPGSGATPGSIPTRIVVNHLYDNHGSSNLFLHEHGHALDALYKSNVVSNSKKWKQLISKESNTFLKQICGSYCVDNRNEGFAELFAYYYACRESRNQLEKELPEIAEFFRNLKSISNL